MEVGHIKNTSRLAIAAVWCAIAAIVLVVLFGLLIIVGVDLGPLTLGSALFAVAAFVLGVLSIVIITIRHKLVKGYFYAILAIVLATPFIFMEVSSIYVAWVRAERKKANTGLYNLEVLHKALVEYANDHDGYLPVADRWCDLLMEHNKNLAKENFKHPQPDRLELRGECHFAFNKNLSRMRLSDIPDGVVLLFEADGDWNLNGTSQLLRTRHKAEYSSIAMLFADKSIKRYWYNKKAVRKFDAKGTHMYYEKPRWKP